MKKAKKKIPSLGFSDDVLNIREGVFRLHRRYVLLFILTCVGMLALAGNFYIGMKDHEHDEDHKKIHMETVNELFRMTDAVTRAINEVEKIKEVNRGLNKILSGMVFSKAGKCIDLRGVGRRVCSEELKKEPN